MAKVTFPKVVNESRNQSKRNEVFRLIEEHLNDKVLYRNEKEHQDDPNHMMNDIDMGGNSLTGFSFIDLPGVGDSIDVPDFIGEFNPVDPALPDRIEALEEAAGILSPITVTESYVQSIPSPFDVRDDERAGTTDDGKFQYTGAGGTKWDTLVDAYDDRPGNNSVRELMTPNFWFVVDGREPNEAGDSVTYSKDNRGHRAEQSTLDAKRSPTFGGDGPYGSYLLEMDMVTIGVCNSMASQYYFNNVSIYFPTAVTPSVAFWHGLTGGKAFHREPDDSFWTYGIGPKDYPGIPVSVPPYQTANNIIHQADGVTTLNISPKLYFPSVAGYKMDYIICEGKWLSPVSYPEGEVLGAWPYGTGWVIPKSNTSIAVRSTAITWTEEPAGNTYKTLVRNATTPYYGSLILKRGGCWCVRSDQPNYNNQAYWESNYARLMEEGAMAPGLTYGADYPVEIGSSDTVDREKVYKTIREERPSLVTVVDGEIIPLYTDENGDPIQIPDYYA